MDDVTEFTTLDPDEVHLVPKGANNFPPLLAKAIDDALDEESVKACGQPDCEACEDALSKKVLRAKDRNSLPDSDFAYIDSKGGRHLPINDAAHVRNALARFNQTHFESDEAKDKARRKIHARAEQLGIDVSDDDASKETLVSDSDATKTVTGTLKVTGTIMTTEPADVTVKGDQASEDAETSKAGPEDTEPGSPEWEHKDVQLGEQAEELISQLAEVVRTFTAREKAEGGDTTAKALTDAITKALEPLTQRELPNPVSKEIDMDADELKKMLEDMLDERDEARRRKAEKKAKNKMKDADDESCEDEDESDDTEKAEKSQPSSELAKALSELDAIKKQVEAIAAQDAKRPTVSAAGIVAALRGPESESAFKALEDRVQSARTHEERLTAQRQLTAAKMIASENMRDNRADEMRYGPGLHPLFKEGTTSPAGWLPEDTAIKGV